MRSTLLSLMPVGRTTSGICSIALLAGLEFTTRTDARVVWFDEIGGRPRSSSWHAWPTSSRQAFTPLLI